LRQQRLEAGFQPSVIWGQGKLWCADANTGEAAHIPFSAYGTSEQVQRFPTEL
jgi:hypothetical protein